MSNTINTVWLLIIIGACNVYAAQKYIKSVWMPDENAGENIGKAIADLEKHLGAKVVKTKLPLDEGEREEVLIREMGKVDALIISSTPSITENTLAKVKGIKWIIRAGSGHDCVDNVAAAKHGILVTNTPMGNATSTAELACLMIMEMSRGIFSVNRALRSDISGTWVARNSFLGEVVEGKNLLVIGLGNIGLKVGEKMHKGMGMHILGYNPFNDNHLTKNHPKYIELIPKAKFEEALRKADYITVHIPLIKKADVKAGEIATEDLIDHQQFKIMKDNVYIINVSRGGIINETALFDNLRDKTKPNNKVVRAGLDVFVEEPPKKGSVSEKLIMHENVVSAPHLGASTTEAQDKVIVDAVEQIITLNTEVEGGASVHASIKKMKSINGDAAIGSGKIANY